MESDSYVAARLIVPLILKITDAQSVVDAGCGLGAWLKVFEENGINDFLGLDGDYVNQRRLLIPAANFLAVDLSRPLNLKRRFDLALSLEVGEHIRRRRAEIFAKNLAALADVIVFSAALPRQGGTHHVNERWPAYWRRLFKKRGYEFLDPFRPRLLWTPGLKSYYKQNLYLVVKRPLLVAAPYRDLPRPPAFVILHQNIFRRHKPLLRLRYLLRKYIFKKSYRPDLS